MTFFQEQDIAPMIAQLGEAVTIGGTPGKAIVRLPDERILEEGGLSHLIGRVIEITLETIAFPVVAPGTAVVRGAENYKIHTPLQTQDGAVTKLLCERA